MAGKFYVTTSIPYASDKPHIGNALDWLYADVLARYHAQHGEQVLYSAGADEHGSKIYEKALANKQQPAEYIETIVPTIPALHQQIGSGYTHFARTNSKQHVETAQKLWQAMGDDIYKSKYEGWYCVGCEEFKTDTEVKASNGICPLHNQPYQKISEENYFFRLSKYNDKLREVIESGEFVVTPETRKNEILSIIKGGLNDMSISRPKEKLAWGIPVPGDPDHVMYVWFEALMNYITLLDYPGGKDFKTFWPTDVQVIGKDNLRFHAAIYPAMLMSLGLPLLKTLLVHGHLTVGGKKMSKTVGNVVSVDDIISRYGQDAFRFYFLRHIPPAEDGDFTWEKFEAAYNNELANELGNLVQRVASMALRYQQGLIGEVPENTHDVEDYHEAMREFRFDKAMDAIWDLVKGANRYLEETKPWELAAKGDDSHLREVLASATSDILQIADILTPFLPQASMTIQEIFKRGAVREYQGVLFPKIELTKTTS